MKKRYYILLVLFSIGFLYLFYNAFFIEKKKVFYKQNLYENVSILRYPHSQYLQEGDIIFRRMYDVESTMACKFSEGEKRYSHVGMIVSQNNKKWVLHILPNQGVVLTPIKIFLAQTKVWAIYRYKELEPSKLNRMALSYLHKNIAFDDNYDLKTKDFLYCTEMIQDIINSTLNKNYVKATKKFVGRQFVTISDMYENNQTTLIERSHRQVSN